MTKKAILSFIGLFILTIGTAGAGYWYFGDKTEVKDNVPTAGNNNYTENRSANTQTQSSNLSVQGATSSNSNSNENQLPAPASFNVYEKYADKSSALFIDTVIGDGSEAVSGDNVAMFYKGWLTTGELFDQSREDEQGVVQPFIFQIGGGQVIQGWDQGIAGMKEGGKRRLIIPATVGYGATGQGPIPGNAMLIFDVELVAVQKPQ